LQVENGGERGRFCPKRTGDPLVDAETIALIASFIRS
jgi:hypothetical protein